MNDTIRDFFNQAFNPLISALRLNRYRNKTTYRQMILDAVMRIEGRNFISKRTMSGVQAMLPACHQTLSSLAVSQIAIFAILIVLCLCFPER